MSDEEYSEVSNEGNLFGILGRANLPPLPGEAEPDDEPPVNDSIWHVNFTYDDLTDRLLFVTANLRVTIGANLPQVWPLITKESSIFDDVRKIRFGFRVHLLTSEPDGEEPEDIRSTGKGRIIITQKAGVFTPSLKDYFGGDEFDIP